MSEYTRRAHLEGATDSDVLAQPRIVGNIPRDSAGEFPALSLPAELRLETESTGPTSVSFTTDKLLTTIVDDINTALSGFVEAEDRDGVLLLRTTGVGEGAFIRVHPEILGFQDSAPIFGFPVHPHPLATVRAGQQGSAPPRPNLQQNPTGSGLLAFGEDRVSSSYNRALQYVSRNADYLYTQTSKAIAVPIVIEVEDTAFWSGRLHFDADGNLDQIDISDLSGLIPEVADRRYWIGNLTRNSTLDEIAQYFSVQDRDDNEMVVDDKIVRIGAVTRGLRPGSAPSFADEYTAPSTPLFNTSGVAPDGGNALGVDRIKATEVITDIRFNSTPTCSGATFDTNGVRTGDVGIISGATVDTPFNHNGTYLVETLVSEEEVVLRPANTSDLDSLNPDDSGAFGTLSISSGGKFEENLFLTLLPPVRFPPENGALRIVLGIEYQLGEIPEDALLISTIRTSEEVDGFVKKRLLQRQNLGGVYDGPGQSKGSGYFGTIDNRPFSASLREPLVGAAVGVTVRSGIGETLAGNILKLDPVDASVEADLGRTVRLTGAPLLEEEPFVVIRLVSGDQVELAPLNPNRGGDDLPVVASVAYEFFDDQTFTLPGVFSATSYEEFLSSVGSRFGYLYERRQNKAGTDKPVHGSSFSHLEQIKLDAGSSNISSNLISSFPSGDEVELAFDPEANSHFRAGDTAAKGSPVIVVPTLAKIVNGPNAGWYVVHATRSVAGGSGFDGVVLRFLDGSTPSFSGPAFDTYISFYNLAISTNIPMVSYPGVAPYISSTLGLFSDSIETEASLAYALHLGWRGAGGGIFAHVNDEGFVAFDNGDGADGSLMSALIYPPADGINLVVTGSTTGSVARRTVRGLFMQAYTHGADYVLEGGSYDLYTGFAGRFSQAGKDPSVLITKHVGASAAAPSMSGVNLTAALLLLDGGGSVGRGGAADVIGSIFQHRDPSGASTDWIEGGIYTELGVGAGRFLIPTIAQVDPDSEPYYGTGTYEGVEAPTTLGTPGQMFPEVTGNPDAVAFFDDPDYVLFNLSHTHMLRSVGTGPGSWPVSSLVGAKVFLPSGSGPGVPFEDEEYTIVAVKESGGLHLALEHPTLGAVGGPTVATFQIRGNRWFRSYLDIASWTQLGTRFHAASEHLSPALTIGQDPTDWVDRTPAGDPFLIQLDTEGTLGTVGFGVFEDGLGVGKGPNLASMLNANVDSATFDGASGFQTGTGYYYWLTPWSEDAEEPRSPFPNVAVIHTSDNILDSSAPGSTRVGDFALEIVSGMTVAEFSEDFGGSLELRSSGSSICRIWMKGARSFNDSIYALRATAKVRPSAGSSLLNIRFQLRTDTGVLLAESSQTDVSDGGGDPAPSEVTRDFTLNDLLNGSYDEIDVSTLYETGVHLVLDVQFLDFASAELLLLELKLEPLGRPAKITSSIDVEGAVRAYKYRHISPVPGYQTVSPASVRFLGGHDYARTLGNIIAANPGENAYGIAEQRSLGLVRLTGGGPFFKPVFNHFECFRRGQHSAAIRAFHPYFDPLWYMEQGHSGAPTNPLTWDRFVLPDRFGFLVPFTPPHGSKLTSLYLGMSFLPVYSNTGSEANFQVFSQIPSGFSSATTRNDAIVKAGWDAVEGVRVRLWRYNSVDFGKPHRDKYDGTAVADFGWAEPFWSRVIDLSGVTEPAFATNTSATDSDDLGTEHFEDATFDLQYDTQSLGGGLALDPSVMIVDRRHFSYFLTAEFYMGLRQVDGTDYEFNPSDDVHWLPTVQTGPYGDFEAIEYPYPPDDTSFNHPAVVKYRGARLGWVTTRSGQGGWG